MGFHATSPNATTVAGITPTAAGLDLLDDASAAAQRATLGVVANIVFEAVAAGTVYSLTGTPAAIDFGTTDPSITITTAGTYRLKMRVNLKLVGATFAGVKNIICTLRRTNNTAADVANGSSTIVVGIITALTQSLAIVELEAPYVTTNVNDVLTIFASVETLPGAGTVDVVEASIHAVRVG